MDYLIVSKKYLNLSFWENLDLVKGYYVKLAYSPLFIKTIFELYMSVEIGQVALWVQYVYSLSYKYYFIFLNINLTISIQMDIYVIDIIHFNHEFSFTFHILIT